MERFLMPPIDVVFDEDEVFQPDIVFIKSENQDIIHKTAIHGIPDLIIGIVSPASTYYDTVEKKEIYRKYGVKECWLILPDERVIGILTLESDEYLEFCKSKKEGLVKSKIVEGLEINSQDVFD
ncbi:MAG: Uma2 family endonuclease [Candidatus Brocadia sp.]|nr:Uma2 family endonuclease [Candidatus Brocadia sp.]MDG5996106.1 Uma2 family endonuclease [Candidatus Brocadia sp.]